MFSQISKRLSGIIPASKLLSYIPNTFALKTNLLPLCQSYPLSRPHMDATLHCTNIQDVISAKWKDHDVLSGWLTNLSHTSKYLDVTCFVDITPDSPVQRYTRICLVYSVMCFPRFCRAFHIPHLTEGQKASLRLAASRPKIKSEHQQFTC